MAAADGFDEEEDSLFEGMILFPTSSSSPPTPPPPLPSASHLSSNTPVAASAAPDTSSLQKHSSTTAEELEQHQQPQYQEEEEASTPSPPFDEDLFSDLTLLTSQQQQQQEEEIRQKPAIPELELKQQQQQQQQPSSSSSIRGILSRQLSRKKKRSATSRIGYGRTAYIDEHRQEHNDQFQHPPSLTPPIPNFSDFPTSTYSQDDHQQINQQQQQLYQEQFHHQQQQQQDEVKEQCKTEDNISESMEDKLAQIRAQILKKLSWLQDKASSVSLLRKQLQSKQRKGTKDLDSSVAKFKELEQKLEEACEAEDFETADRVSESLAAAEKDKDRLLSALRQAEADCDAAEAQLQEVLNLQIEAEEEGVKLLQQFAKDAADNADVGYKNAEEISTKEFEEWQSLMESVGAKKFEVEVESCIVNEAREGLDKRIEHLVEDDRREKEMLRGKHDILSKELEDLLALVKMKEAEIAENDYQMQEVDRRISSVTSQFHEIQSSIDKKCDDLLSCLSRLDAEGKLLAQKKEEIDNFLRIAEEKRSKLKDHANLSSDEAITCQELAGLRKSLALSALKLREEKVRLAKLEGKISDDINILRQEVSASRNSLQELASSRASIQQEITSFKQRIAFIDKRGPELEAEKKVAAAARNFKEAGRIAAEAKALSLEREGLQGKLEKDVSDIENVEQKIKETADKIQENEELVSSKEKEAATATYKRLWLVASVARAERRAALELGDIEEADILLHEAEATESRAKVLKEAYTLELEDCDDIIEHYVPISFITSITGDRLAEMAASFHLTVPHSE